ncbi:MAG: hypothetical protein CR997_13695 [Acidobacteria bacterium]|nr:MAG: hypothetical protein CR997_13695 [Acidobacteriota bacterium]
MNTKLTLRLDKQVIEEAKAYAQQKQKSLSALVEQYFLFLTKSQKENSELSEISSTIQQMSGILDLRNTDESKESYADFLTEKYSK